MFQNRLLTGHSRNKSCTFTSDNLSTSQPTDANYTHKHLDVVCDNVKCEMLPELSHVGFEQPTVKIN